MTDYELVIGIETHVQLGTRTKLFCSCPLGFGVQPNTQVCPVCLGHPGTLPVLNKAAFELGLRAGLALNCQIAPVTKFDRKHYFYPDLPKNYQISQSDMPFSTEGFVELEGGRKIGIFRAHLEEDAGKLIHEEKGNRSFVDLNRAGTPLCEIVTKPDIRSSDEAYLYMTTLRMILRYAGVSECDLEKGEMRCDINLSIRVRGTEKLGTKVEIKNLNSFKNAKAAIEYEYGRQVRAVEASEPIMEETRLWDVELGTTRVMRTKEQAHDYRFFPEPDLPPVEVSEDWIKRLKDQLPEFPAQKRTRLVRDYGLSEYDAKVLSGDPAVADYFEKTTKLVGDPKVTANWVVNELGHIMNDLKIEIGALKITPESLSKVILLVGEGHFTTTVAKNLLIGMAKTGKTDFDSHDLSKISDLESLEKSAKLVIVANPKAAADFLGGKDAAIKSLIGAIMKETRGRADPKLAEATLRRLLV